MTKASATITYARVVPRKTVRIALMIAALNDLHVNSLHILNVYMQAPLTEKVWTTLGPAFGKNAHKAAVIVRALYDLKQQEQLLVATLQDAWNPWGASSVRLTLLYG